MKKYLIIIICSATTGAFLTILLNSLGIENSSVYAGGITGGIVGAIVATYLSKED